MIQPKRRWWVVGTGALLAAFVAIPVFARQAAPNQDVLNALLLEVRGLRAAIEQMSSAGARVQLAMGRLQLQEQRINTMLRRAEGIRDQKAAAERELAERQSHASQLEEAAERSPDPNLRTEAAQMVQSAKREVQQRAGEVQRLVAEETEVANAIAAEQSRWSDINRTLEEL